jgi:chitin disaccharide deacetylase
MRRLVVNADDLGLSPGVNEGILEAHTTGIVTSASLMVNRPGAEHAATLLAAHPSLSSST